MPYERRLRKGASSFEQQDYLPPKQRVKNGGSAKRLDGTGFAALLIVEETRKI
jgi:hypothetical protein